MITQTITPANAPISSRKQTLLFEEAIRLYKIAYFEIKKDEAPEIKRERVIAMVAGGIVLNTYQPLSRRSLRDIHVELRMYTGKISFNVMYRSMVVASRFSNQIERFKEWYQYESQYDTLSGVYTTLITPRVVGYSNRSSKNYYNPLETAMGCIDDMAVYARRGSEANLEMTQKLAILRQYIDARLPSVADIGDDTFFKYSPCASCGKHPRLTDGYELYNAKFGEIEVVVPMCRDCLSKEEEVNWPRVSHMYFLYSLSLQSEMDRYTGTSSNMIAPGIYNVEL